jgi:hypothetical protein
MWHRGTKLLGARRLHANGTTSELGNATSYNIASTSFILAGGDDYRAFAAAPFLFPSGPTMDEMMMADLAAAAPGAVRGRWGGGRALGGGVGWGGGGAGGYQRQRRRAPSPAHPPPPTPTPHPPPPTPHTPHPTPHTPHPTPHTPHPTPLQITVPDPAKERRIINCAMPYVDCAQEELYGPCCLD